jgi:hypothetical protein
VLSVARDPWVRSAPGFPCALSIESAKRQSKLGQFMSRERACMSNVIASEAKQSIVLHPRRDGLLRRDRSSQ